MLVSIDGEERAELISKGDTVQQVLDNAKATLAQSDRMIVRVECDGEGLTGDRIDAVLPQQADIYSKIDFQTAEPTELASEALHSTRQLLGEIEKTCDGVAELLSQSQVKKAMELMGKLFGYWNDAYHGIFNTMSLMGIDPESVEMSTGNAATTMNQVLEQLQDVKGSLENQDYTQLADLLAYELKPVAKEWLELVNSLLEKVQEKP